ncbi:MAG: GNAT family N-acetyltransferase [Acidimicrobiaceae bacterium]
MTSNTEFSVRRSNESDHIALRAIRLEALRDSPAAYGSTYKECELWTPARWKEMASGNCYLGEIDGEVVGMATGGFNTDFPNTLWLFGMFVSPKARGSGVGIDLVGAVEEWAKSQGGDELYLHVTQTMQRARAFYTKIGFSLNRGSVTMDRDPSIQLVTMVKKLG